MRCRHTADEAKRRRRQQSNEMGARAVGLFAWEEGRGKIHELCVPFEVVLRLRTDPETRFRRHSTMSAATAVGRQAIVMSRFQVSTVKSVSRSKSGFFCDKNCLRLRASSSNLPFPPQHHKLTPPPAFLPPRTPRLFYGFRIA